MLPVSGGLEGLTAEIRRHEEEARQSARGAIAHKIEIGKLLMAAKKHLPKGDFGQWAQLEFGWTRQHVARHMRLARNGSRVLQMLGPDASLRMGLAAIGAPIERKAIEAGESHLWRLVGEAEWQGEGEPTAEQLLAAVKHWTVRRAA